MKKIWFNWKIKKIKQSSLAIWNTNKQNEDDFLYEIVFNAEISKNHYDMRVVKMSTFVKWVASVEILIASDLEYQSEIAKSW